MSDFSQYSNTTNLIGISGPSNQRKYTAIIRTVLSLLQAIFFRMVKSPEYKYYGLLVKSREYPFKKNHALHCLHKNFDVTHTPTHTLNTNVVEY